MVDLSITIYTCRASLFMFINKKFKKTPINYCAHWLGEDDQKIDFSIIPMGVMLHTI